VVGLDPTSRMPRTAPSSLSSLAAGKTRDDDVEEADDAVDNGHNY